MERLRPWFVNVLVTLGLFSAITWPTSEVSAADWGKSFFQPHCVASTSVESGTFWLEGGVLRQAYWPISHEGQLATLMADSLLRAKRYMAQHDGDWCWCKLSLEDGATYVIDSVTTIVLVLANGDSVRSTQILTADSPREERFWKATEAPLIFRNDGCPYARSLLSQSYVLYVRFPAKSCLSGKGDDEFRRFKSPPVSIRVDKDGRRQRIVGSLCRGKG